MIERQEIFESQETIYDTSTTIQRDGKKTDYKSDGENSVAAVIVYDVEDKKIVGTMVG